MYSLFLDDIRSPRTPPPHGEWITERSSFDCLITIAERGFPNHISIDADIDKSDSSLELVSKLIEIDLQYFNKNKMHLFPDNFTFKVHCKNGPHGDAIERMLKNRLSTIRLSIT